MRKITIEIDCGKSMCEKCEFKYRPARMCKRLGGQKLSTVHKSLDLYPMPRRRGGEVMTVTRQSLVFCDGGDDCPNEGEPLMGGESFDTVTEQLSGSGWVRRNGKHFCESCKRSPNNDRT